MDTDNGQFGSRTKQSKQVWILTMDRLGRGESSPSRCGYCQWIVQVKEEAVKAGVDTDNGQFGSKTKQSKQVWILTMDSLGQGQSSQSRCGY